jgi:plasmid stabilization system protein ParE
MRIKPIVILPAAAQDVDDAYSWYERQKSGLGMRFLAAINVSFQAIQRTPAGFQIVHPSYRKLLLRGFPYGIFYREEEEQIFIAAVLHTARNPKEWQDRLQ